MKIERKAQTALNSPRFCNTGTFMRMPRLCDTEKPRYAIVGVPFDTASSYRSGSRFGPAAIRSISAMIKPNNVLLGINVFESICGADYGDVRVVPGYIHPTYQAIEEELLPLVQAGVLPIVLGGDHSITLAEMRAVEKKHGKLSMIHFDSHSDLCDEVFGEKYNHGTPFRRALEEGLIDPYTSMQLGMRGSLYDPNEHEMARQLGFALIPAHEIRRIGLGNLPELIRARVGNNPVFLTFDIDFVDPAYAPGTGTPEVGGFTSSETLDILRALVGLNYVGFDVVEVLPAYDHGEITAYLAANIVFEFISLLAAATKDKGAHQE